MSIFRSLWPVWRDSAITSSRGVPVSGSGLAAHVAKVARPSWKSSPSLITLPCESLPGPRPALSRTLRIRASRKPERIWKRSLPLASFTRARRRRASLLRATSRLVAVFVALAHLNDVISECYTKIGNTLSYYISLQH